MNAKLAKGSVRQAHAFLPFPTAGRESASSFPSALNLFWPRRVAIARAETFASRGDGDWNARSAGAIRSVREGASHGKGEHLRHRRDRAHQASAEGLAQLRAARSGSSQHGTAGRCHLALGRQFKENGNHHHASAVPARSYSEEC